MPIQKPGRSVQDYATPKDFLLAVTSRLYIYDFCIDLAASKDNCVVPYYLGLDNNSDALHPQQSWTIEDCEGEWAWLNPPFAHIGPWVEKAAQEARRGAHIAVLVPASVGANWWRDFVVPYAYQVFLNGRITFVGQTAPYPKDCALLLYTPWGFTGNEVWTWGARSNMPEVSEAGISED